MASLNTILNYTNELLTIAQFDDYCPNGLQVQGKPEVTRLIGGVTACQELIDKAIENGADAILVHHGYFWKGEEPAITGMKYERIRSLIKSGLSLLAYHLPLDAHPLYGNNTRLASLLGITVDGGFAPNGGVNIAQSGRFNPPVTRAALTNRLATVLGREPLVFTGHDREIETVGLCTGAAQSLIEEAASLGLDAYITGEVSEHTWHAARELGINFYGAGHHATERYGVMALGQHLSDHFGLEFRFIDIENPV